MTLFSLGFAVCELRKALIYKGIWRAGKTPKAGVAGSIPAGRTKSSMKSIGVVAESIISVFSCKIPYFPQKNCQTALLLSRSDKAVL